ncbi:MAG: site-2 protease family protein [candidate division NC10 bacterium]|nr:site-2 protease family protein [candidate division NC10 bacterium]
MSTWEEPIEGLLFALGRELDGIFAISDWEVHNGTFRFRGRLMVDPEWAIRVLSRRYAPYGYYPLLQHEDEIALLKAVPRSKAAKPWVNLVLLGATLLTTLSVGAANEGADIFSNPSGLLVGFPFALSLLLILGIHELGHYFTARYYGVEVTLPYFIPAPIGLGTFGAFIKMKSPVTDRKALFDVGLAGPLAGLVIALPVLIIGLKFSEIITASPPGQIGILLGSPLLFSFLQWLTLGSLPENVDVLLHPVAFAGWIGLFVTALNLLPIGQLDGGHVSYALLGRHHREVAIATLLGLAIMGILAWPGWLFWAGLALVLGLKHPPPLNDVTPLDRRRRVVGVLAFFLLLSLITPAPFSLP